MRSQLLLKGAQPPSYRFMSVVTLLHSLSENNKVKNLITIMELPSNCENFIRIAQGIAPMKSLYS